MVSIPSIYGVSDLRVRQQEILARLREGPVVLTQRARAVAVLVSPERWNELVAELEELQDLVAAREARLDAEPGMDLEQYVAARGAHVPRATE